jgi:putative membrane protein
MVALPMVLTTLFFAVTRRFERHRRLARFTFPLWLYVSVTGVLVFFLLSRYG